MQLLVLLLPLGVLVETTSCSATDEDGSLEGPSLCRGRRKRAQIDLGVSADRVQDQAFTPDVRLILPPAIRSNELSKKDPHHVAADAAQAVLGPGSDELAVLDAGEWRMAAAAMNLCRRSWRMRSCRRKPVRAAPSCSSVVPARFPSPTTEMVAPAPGRRGVSEDAIVLRKNTARGTRRRQHPQMHARLRSFRSSRPLEGGPGPIASDFSACSTT